MITKEFEKGATKDHCIAGEQTFPNDSFSNGKQRTWITYNKKEIQGMERKEIKKEGVF